LAQDRMAGMAWRLVRNTCFKSSGSDTKINLESPGRIAGRSGFETYIQLAETQAHHRV
jgi:hypothetical protein